MKLWPFGVVSQDKDMSLIQVEYFTILEISSMILEKMKMPAEAYLGHDV